MRKYLWRLAATAAAVLLVACSGGGNSGTSTKQLRFIMVSHGGCDFSFFVPMCKGLSDAASAMGVSAIYRGTKAVATDPNGQRQLILSAIAEKPDGLIVTDCNPDVLDPTIKQAIEAGIPTVLSNCGGTDEVAKLGALVYIGNDELGTGVIAGKQFNASGVKHALIVTLAPGTIPYIDDRNNGFLKTFTGQITRVDVSLNTLIDANQMKGVYQAALTKDPTIDGVYSIGSCCSAAMLAARDAVGSSGTSMHLGTIDLTTNAINALQGHKMDFALDQQQYNQGFLPVVVLTNYLRYGLTPGSALIATGPGLVTPDNVGKFVAAGKARFGG